MADVVLSKRILAEHLKPVLVPYFKDSEFSTELKKGHDGRDSEYWYFNIYYGEVSRFSRPIAVFSVNSYGESWHVLYVHKQEHLDLLKEATEKFEANHPDLKVTIKVS